MTSRSLRKRRTTRPNTPASTRGDRGRVGERRASAPWSVALCVAALAVAAPAAAAEPAVDRGAALLKALRDRDADARWRATEATAATEPAPTRPLPMLAPPARVALQAEDAPAEPGTKPDPFLPNGNGMPGEGTDPGDSANPDDPGDLGDEKGAERIDPVPGGVAATPDELRRIKDILPYWDYEPDPDVEDPCQYLCPRPDGAPCKQYDDPDDIPACPKEATLAEGPFCPPIFPPSVFAWKASNIHYNPLYFEDVPLERYGHTYGCLQPAVSLGKFGVQLVGLPYQMALDPPHKCVYPLGYYRPGDPAPKLCYQVPFNARAAAVTAGFYGGAAAILP